MLTKQIWLNRLRDASLGGKFPSISDNSACMYRGPNNTACAVGINIPEELMPKYKGEVDNYNSVCVGGEYKYNNASVRQLVEWCPELTPYVIPEHSDISAVQSVQKVHDSLAHSLATEQQSNPSATWNHEHFMERLLALECFKGMQPSAEISEFKLPTVTPVSMLSE